MKIAFITNFCPHYRVKTFETLARYHDVNYFFFSKGDEWYWQKQHGVKTGDFCDEYLHGFQIGGVRITPTLIRKLWHGNYDAYIKCITGRFALPVSYIVARLKRKPFILWSGIWMRLLSPAHRLFFPLTRFIYKHSNAIVVYGEHVKCYLITEGVSPEKIFVAGHSVDNEEYDRNFTEKEKNILRKKLKIECHQKILFYLGRLEKVKGLPYLLEAFSLLKRDDSVLVIAGIGSGYSHLQKLARQKKIDEFVRFVGYVPPEDTVIYYSIAWVCILPSITLSSGKETWGLVVNESFNQGVPIIVTSAVGAAAGGMVKNGINGFVIPEKDSVALCMALKKILDEPDLRDFMGRNAKKTISGWNNEQMVMGFLNAIEYAVKKISH
jgi:glycosyltransferase involved in cell wall biosynthesis